jgi:hypothetical protein
MRHIHHLARIGLVTAAALALTVASADPADAQAKCAAAKVKAAGKKAGAKAKCHSKAVGKGDPVDPDCLLKAETKFSSSFARPKQSRRARRPAMPTRSKAGSTHSSPISRRPSAPRSERLLRREVQGGREVHLEHPQLRPQGDAEASPIQPASQKAVTKLQNGFTSADGKAPASQARPSGPCRAWPTRS